jgi:hypothetical protein
LKINVNLGVRVRGLGEVRVRDMITVRVSFRVRFRVRDKG